MGGSTALNHAQLISTTMMKNKKVEELSGQNNITWTKMLVAFVYIFFEILRHRGQGQLYMLSETTGDKKRKKRRNKRIAVTFIFALIATGPERAFHAKLTCPLVIESLRIDFKTRSK